MSQQLGRVISEVLHRHFGDIVQQVGKDLFSYGCRPLPIIVRSTGLPRNQVVESLRTLIKFHLATFESCENDTVAEYKLVPEKILLLIRYPRYLLQIKTAYGSEAELLVEELLQQAMCSATKLLVTVAIKYKDDKEKTLNMVTLKDTFISLATAGYFQQSPVEEPREGCEVPTLVPVATIVPDLDTRALLQAMANPAEITDKVYWEVNYDRFHQDFRDDLMVKAIIRRLDENAGELMRLLLQQMYLTSPAWAPVSNPIPALDVRDICRRLAADKPLLQQHMDHYLKLLEENGVGFVRRSGEASGGSLTVRNEQASEELLRCILERTVTERLGSNAARIFRLILSKKYIEEDDIQKHAMLPNKECKQLTYKLLEEHFISVQPMRKAASAGGLAKTIYLYHVKLNETAHTAQEMCYRALCNVLSRGAHERRTHGRLLDKQRRVRTVVHGMRMRGEPQQTITDVEETMTPPELAVLSGVEKRIKQLSTAELELDRNLFIFSWYFMYPH